jgi:hypothetical protein
LQLSRESKIGFPGSTTIEVRPEQYKKTPPPILVTIITQNVVFLHKCFKYLQYIYNIRDIRKYGYNSSGSYNLTTAAPSELVVK